MISFEKFKEYIDKYKELLDKEERLDDALKAFSLDFGGFNIEDMHELFPKMLAELTRDKDDWIGYFIYELNWGRDWTENSVTEMDGTPIKLQTIEDLYNLLESEYEDEKKE